MDLSIVNGRIRVAQGQLVGVDLPALVKRGHELSMELVRRTEKRYNVDMTRRGWRRAFPYDALNVAG